MVFANIGYLFLLLLLIPYIVWYIMKGRKSDASLQVSDTKVYAKAPKSLKLRLLHVPFLLRIITFTLIILILARPQSTNSWKNSETEGIDIMMCLDVSTTMLIEDIRPNRIQAAEDVAANFINGRPNDNIGLTVFAGETFTQCPLTIDHAVLLNLFQGVKSGMLPDGTAIGMGIASAVAHLRNSKAKSKVIILLTDGSNNMGDISPLTAAEMARTYGIRIYTIGVGTNGMARYPVAVGGTIQYLTVPVEFDEKTLVQIAQTTNGAYYHATSRSKLEKVYQQIDKLEKTKLNVKSFHKRTEMYQPFALLALLSVLLEILLRQTVLKKLP
jgi:Ca-activated chloride channel family protein